ncbi:RNA polymerase factor sigma-54 [Pararobbsia silviterrae]|uniref:RNA polymerase sigma-54 factor n=1 Tax=Pararobbsia silviterrae TaxID=1792498 RepID=A0A494Y948_9BURK|nr:RNA polymerase factor sigma-54 [Pararobbsia silviterrae]RKP59209.1 RNA polymerase factor sigma-54 [Pararobbsia silviterrae]
MHPTVELRAKQSLTLTPRLQQSVRLLQLSSMEFAQELRQALDTNPFLEFDDGQSAEETDTQDEAGLDAAAGEDPATSAEFGETASALANDAITDTASHDLAPDGQDVPAEVIADALADTDERDGAAAGDFPADPYAQRSTRHDGEDNDPTEWIHAKATLRDHLHEALRMCAMPDRDAIAAQLIIEALDDDGYLRQSLDELAKLVTLDPPMTEDDLHVALTLVQRLDAPGLAARSLSECLSLQLQALPSDTEGRDIALQIVNHHLDRMARRELAELQRQLGCPADQIRIACALVRKLDPRPGDAFGRDENNYIVPDVIVRSIKNRWVVQINPAVQPRTRIHRMYAEMFAQCGATSRSPLAQQLQEARWLIRNAQQRFTTIQRVAECIVAHQKAFFEYGEIALKPMVLRDVAEELGLHESTVSRATGNKYMATPRGIFEFKHFFPRELSTESGGTCSSAAVRALLKEMIDAEDVASPLSDVTLAKLLADQGVIVARRTVAKYRRLMKVPPAEMRRQLQAS